MVVSGALKEVGSNGKIGQMAETWVVVPGLGERKGDSGLDRGEIKDKRMRGELGDGFMEGKERIL